jgi:methylmalonyl-CoA mutase cobalamin-binding domain/chain
VVVGGIIPTADVGPLTRLGVAAILTPGASAAEIVAAMTVAIVGLQAIDPVAADPSPTDI